MDLEKSVTKWIVHLEDGDEEAARVIWDKFFSRASALAKRKLANATQNAVDNEDVALSAMNALCRGMQERRFKKVENRDDLWQILAMLTSRKAIDVKRKAGRRKEVGEAALQNPERSQRGIENVADASHEGEFMDNLSLVADEMISLLDPKLKPIALWKLEGYTNREIAEKLDRSIATIERYLKMIRLRWQGWHADESKQF